MLQRAAACTLLVYSLLLSLLLQAPSAEVSEQAMGSSAGIASKPSPSRPLGIRPSMEARRRRLGLSILQVGSIWYTAV